MEWHLRPCAGKRLRGSRPGELNGSGSNGRTYPSPGGGEEAANERAERVTGAADAIRPDQLGPRKSADFRCWSVVLLFAFAGTIRDAG